MHTLRVATGTIIQHPLLYFFSEFRFLVNGIPKTVRVGKRLSGYPIEPGKVVVHVDKLHRRIDRVHSNSYGEIIQDRINKGLALPERLRRSPDAAPEGHDPGHRKNGGREKDKKGGQ